MKIVSPEAHLIDHAGVTPYQFIEKIGRTCYKSLDHITEVSAIKFVGDLCERKHLAMLEHEWAHLRFNGNPLLLEEALNTYAWVVKQTKGGQSDVTKFMELTYVGTDFAYLSAPLRVFIEMLDEIGDMKVIVPGIIENMIDAVHETYTVVMPQSLGHRDNAADFTMFVSLEDFIRDMNYAMTTRGLTNVIGEDMKHITHTVWFQCDRGVSHEIVRHRVASFAQESTRYCNYSKDKFGSEITVIKPFFFNRNPDTAANVLYDDSTYSEWLATCERCERGYFSLLNKGATPQEARSVLPNSLKTEIIVTTNECEWQHIINLRYLGTTGAPHPQMKEVMGLIVNDLVTMSEGRLHQ